MYGQWVLYCISCKKISHIQKKSTSYGYLCLVDKNIFITVVYGPLIEFSENKAKLITVDKL